MKALSLLAALLLAGPSCLSTRVEVETEVYADGSVQRSLRVTSVDDGEPAAHPPALRPPGLGYLMSRQQTGLWEASGSFGPGQSIPPIFGFRSETLARDAPAQASLEVVDWGLFRLFRFREQLGDVVQLDEIRAAVEETAGVLIDNADQSLRRLLGPEYARTRLHRELQGEWRKLGRELALEYWRSLAFGDFDEEEAAERLVRVLRRVGAPVEAPLLLAAVEEGQQSEAYLQLRRQLGDWAREQLELVVEDPRSGREPSWPDMRALLFDGAFVLAYEEELQRRFGGEDGVARWFGESMARIFGLFGSSPGDIDFHLRVRLPGEPLRSNGYLSGDGAAFLEFPARSIYPSGAGLSSESVLWEGSVTGGLPAFPRLSDNEAAVRWTWLAGEGPESRPDPEFLELLRRCARTQSWAPLADFDSKDEARKKRAEQLLAWLRGEAD